jgi:hypothetical protein
VIWSFGDLVIWSFGDLAIWSFGDLVIWFCLPKQGAVSRYKMHLP